MLSNALNDECTGRSPCRDCPRHLQGLDKNQCVDKCDRLAAYRNGEPWEGLAVPVYEHGAEEVVGMEKETLMNIPVEKGAAGIAVENQEKRKYHKAIIQPDPARQARGILNKKAGGKCLRDDCEIEDGLVRGLCRKHYQAWRKGLIHHPILGEFAVFQAKSHTKRLVKRGKQMSKDSKASYYDAGGIETLDIIKAKLTPEQYKGYLLGCSLKYQCRLMHKFGDEDRIRDAEKAANYSQWLLEAFKN